jgi:AraC-like DNA-binding protein
MPRGGLQIVQPASAAERWVRAYGSEFHAEDSASWRAIIENRTISDDEGGSVDAARSRYHREFLADAKLRHGVVAPVKAPLLPGFDGALHLYRTAEQGKFTEAEIKIVTETAQQISVSAKESRAQRVHGDCAEQPAWVPRVTSRLIIYNAALQPVFADGLKDLEERIAEQLVDDARRRLQHLDGHPVYSDRVALADSSGQLWVFRAVAYRSYPALGDGAMVFYCLMPTFCEWISLRASDVSADSELSRLVPAIQYMHEHFRRGPTLGEISRHVHLSPFHFHRRFTELLGITPKHFLLECQIFQAKRLLYGRQAELAEIAKTCGFAHQSHFTSRFKQFVGLTPTRWRKLALRGEESARGHGISV